MQNVHGLGHGCALVGVVDVGQDRHAEFFADFRQNRQAFIHADTACGIQGRSVCFVETGFIDPAHASCIRRFGDLFGHHAGVIQPFDLAGPCDQGKGGVVRDSDIADLDGFHDSPSCFRTASIRSTSMGLFSSQNTRPRPSTGTQVMGQPFSRKRSCSSPSAFSSGPSGHDP